MNVLIPSINESPYLNDLLDLLSNETCVEFICIVNNSDEELEFYQPEKVGVIHAQGRSIYDAWNIGISQSRHFNSPVAILNDDIILTKGSLFAVDLAFQDPSYGLIGLDYTNPRLDLSAPVRQVYGTYRTGGFGGFAFVLAPDMPEVDGRFRWWYGDDDLGKRVMQTGRKLGVHTGAPVEHPFPSTTGFHHEWTGAAIPQDERLFTELWGKPW